MFWNEVGLFVGSWTDNGCQLALTLHRVTACGISTHCSPQLEITCCNQEGCESNGNFMPRWYAGCHYREPYGQCRAKERVSQQRPRQPETLGGKAMRYTILSNLGLIISVLAVFGKSIWGVMGNSTWGNSTWGPRG